MGARNVAAAYAMWGHLDHGPFRLLVGMAFTALDAPSKEGRPARVYFGGEEGLVGLYGRGGKAVYNALAALRRLGAVTVMDNGRNGHRAVYKLNLDAFPGLHEGSSDVTLQTPIAQRERVTSRDPKGSSDVTEGSRDVTEGSSDVTPRKDEEVTRRSPRGRTSPKGTPHQRATTPGDDEIDYSTAAQIVQAALGIEAAAKRIGELAADGADYTTAMVTLAHQIQEARA